MTILWPSISPAGMLVHRPERGPKSAQKRCAHQLDKEHYPETNEVGDTPSLRPGIVHRLDEDTSGILLIAKNQHFATIRKVFSKTRGEKNLSGFGSRPDDWEGRIEKPIGLISVPSKGV